MRHRKNNIRLGRKNTHRKNTLRSLAGALLVNESIKTTKVKAKEAQPLIDKLITMAKRNTPESKRGVFRLTRDKNLIELLFNEIAPRFKTRNSGYTRLIPIYPRRGDGSPMTILELVEKKPVVETKKPPRVEKKKEAPKKEAKPSAKATPPPAEKVEEKKERKTTPEAKIDIKEEVQKERAKKEDKKIKKGGLFKNLRRYFRGKSS